MAGLLLEEANDRLPKLELLFKPILAGFLLIELLRPLLEVEGKA